MRGGNMKLSIIVPIYKVERYLSDCIESILQQSFRDFELILVNDASKDNSLAVLKRLSQMDQRVRFIHLAKNHGQQKAVLCGIEYSGGDFVITMDDDLQHPPEEIPKLIAKMESDPNIDVVIGMYDSKKHNSIRKLGTKMLDTLSNIVFKKDKKADG